MSTEPGQVQFRTLIRERFAVRLSEVSVGRLMKKVGLSRQKPLRRAYQLDPEAVRRWLEEEYPQIKAAAKRAGATIYFGDEAGVRSDFHAGTTWAPRGQTPVVHTTGAGFGLNMISAVTPRGGLRFMLVKGKMTAGKFCVFLKRLLHKARRPIFLIVDGLPPTGRRRSRGSCRRRAADCGCSVCPRTPPNSIRMNWCGITSRTMASAAAVLRAPSTLSTSS